MEAYSQLRYRETESAFKQINDRVSVSVKEGISTNNISKTVDHNTPGMLFCYSYQIDEKLVEIFESIHRFFVKCLVILKWMIKSNNYQ